MMYGKSGISKILRRVAIYELNIQYEQFHNNRNSGSPIQYSLFKMLYADDIRSLKFWAPFQWKPLSIYVDYV